MEANQILEALQWRYATKKYDTSKKVDEEKVNVILEAGRLSPSSFGIQPRSFVVIHNKELIDKLAAHAYHQPQLVSASHLIVLCGYDSLTSQHAHDYVDHALSHGGEADRLENYRTMLVDKFTHFTNSGEAESYISNQVYIALGSMVLAAAELKVDASPMGGFDPKAFDEVLGLKEKGLHSVVLLALGHRDETDKAGHVKKVRRPAEKVIIRM